MAYYEYCSSSVDCTLSLGTPSTRRTSDDTTTNFCWDFLPPSKSYSNPSNSFPSQAAAAAAHDPLLGRRCANCDTTSTPLWRNGPRGPKSLCNACGIRFKKEERRATAAATAAAASAGGSWAGNYNEYRFIDDGGRDYSEPGMHLLSWRPTTLVYDFTR